MSKSAHKPETRYEHLSMGTELDRMIELENRPLCDDELKVLLLGVMRRNYELECRVAALETATRNQMRLLTAK